MFGINERLVLPKDLNEKLFRIHIFIDNAIQFPYRYWFLDKPIYFGFWKKSGEFHFINFKCGHKQDLNF